MYEDGPRNTNGPEEEITDVLIESLLGHRVEINYQESTEPVEHGAYCRGQSFGFLREELRVEDPGEGPEPYGEPGYEGDGGRDGEEGESVDSSL